MKLLFGFLFIALTLNGVLTLPARNNPQDDAEVISQPRQPSSDPDFHDFKGVIDTGSGYPFLQPHPSSFNLGFFDSFEDIFRRLRSRLWPVIPSGFGGANDDGTIGTGDDSSDDSGSGFSFGLRPLIPLNPKNGNTTSTVKVVDGHKVEINETVYGDSNNVFKVRVVNVRPLASGEEVAETVTSNQGEEAKPAVAAAGPSTSSPFKPDEYDDEDENDRREPLEKQPKENEIRDIDGPQTATTTTTTATTTIASPSPAIDSIAESTDIRQNITANMEEQHHQQQHHHVESESHLAQDVTTMQQYNEETEELDDSHNHNEPHEHESLTAIENFDDNHEDDEEPEPESESEQHPHKEREELESSDDEDGEVQTPPTMSDTFNDEWSSLDQEQTEDAGNDLDNNIDVYENFVPIDISNDIAVNDAAAADPEFPVNPDAEFIEIPTEVHYMMPKFEKLSMGPMPPTEMK